MAPEVERELKASALAADCGRSRYTQASTQSVFETARGSIRPELVVFHL
jgi:hypothetical protein